MSYDSNNRWSASANTSIPQVGIDVGLRNYMLRVYNYMAGGLAITGIVAYIAAASGFYQAIFGTALSAEGAQHGNHGDGDEEGGEQTDGDGQCLDSSTERGRAPGCITR